MKCVSVKKAGKAAEGFLKDVMAKPATAIGVEKADGGWRVALEVVDDPGAGFDPILGLYEVTLNEAMEAIGYRRESLRRRSELEWRKPTM